MTPTQPDWLTYSPEESLQTAREVEAEGQPPTRYVDADANQMRRWQDAGLCMWCGSQDRVGDCYCRRCDSCVRTWIANTIKDTDDGRPPFEDCPECKSVRGGSVKWFH